MSRSSRRKVRVRWNHPLTIAVIPALIAVAGGITVAIVNNDAATPKPDDTKPARPLVIVSVTVDRVSSVSESFTVTGTSGPIPLTHAIFAVAVPAAKNTWFASEPASPDESGAWSAEIHVDLSQATNPFTVQAVETEARIECPPGKDCSPPEFLGFGASNLVSTSTQQSVG
jgi:hypothetical protein